MSDVSNARIDYPHVPRALLEMLDFYNAEKVNRPHIKAGKRPAFVAYLVLTGCLLDDAIHSQAHVLRPDDHELLVGNKIVYLIDVNQYFRELG